MCPGDIGGVLGKCSELSEFLKSGLIISKFHNMVNSFSYGNYVNNLQDFCRYENCVLAYGKAWTIPWVFVSYGLSKKNFVRGRVARSCMIL